MKIGVGIWNVGITMVKVKIWSVWNRLHSVESCHFLSKNIKVGGIVHRTDTTLNYGISQ